jgi:hypothetical protein
MQRYLDRRRGSPMLQLTGLLLALVLLMRFGPDIPFTRMLSMHLVERPLRWLSKHERHDYLYFIIITAMVIGGGEMILVLGPEFMMLYAADLALYLDVMAVSYLLAAVAKVKAAVLAVRTRLSAWGSRIVRPRRAAPRERASRKPASRADNDDEDDSQPLRIAA